MLYMVNMREVHIQPVRIEASSSEEAIEKVKEGEGEYVDNALEYNHTLSSEYWTVDLCV